MLDYVRAWLGSRRKVDPVREPLFASQSLHELCALPEAAAATGAWPRLAEALARVKAGDTAGAVAILRSVLAAPPIPSRIELWVWTALRELGQKPERPLAYEVLGVVLEIPVGRGVDTLAAYADGAARYLNHSGKILVWDVRDSKVKSLCQALLDSTIPASALARTRATLAAPKSRAQATMLTRSGLFVIGTPSQAIVDAGTALMLELIKRSEAAAA